MKPSSFFSRAGETPRVPAPRFRWSTRVGLPLAGLLAFGLLFAGSLTESLTPALEVAAKPVIEAPALERSARSESAKPRDEVLVQAAGWIEPEPFPVHAVTLTDGIVEEVLFLEGDEVVKDQVLARLVDEDALLALQRAEVEARAAEETWEANVATRREAAVAEAALAETRAALELARAELDREKALLRETEAVFERRRGLVESRSISREEFDTAQAAARAQAASVQVVEHRIDSLKAKQQRMEAEARAARRNLELRTEERRRLELARVALAEARLRVERLEIRAPIAGRVMQRLVEPGSMLMAFSENAGMSRVAALYDPEALQVRVDVPLADAAKVGVGQPARVTVEVLPDEIFAGTVTRVTNFADIQKNTLEVKVGLDEPSAILRPEMLARVRFLATERPGSEQATATGMSVFAPAEAVREGMAWVVSNYDGERGVAQRRVVTLTGAENKGWLEIDRGLRPGDLIVVAAKGPLREGQPLRVRPERKD